MSVELLEHCGRRPHVPSKMELMHSFLETERRVSMSKTIERPTLAETCGRDFCRLDQRSKTPLEGTDRLSVWMTEHKAIERRFVFNQLRFTNLSDICKVFSDISSSYDYFSLPSLSRDQEDNMRFLVSVSLALMTANVAIL